MVLKGWSFNPDIVANSTGGQGNFAIANSDQAGEVDMDTKLRSPIQDFSNFTSVKLHFKNNFEKNVENKINEIADVIVL